MRQSKFKKKYDPELGRLVMDILKNIGSKVIGQTLKKLQKLLRQKL